MLFNLGSVVATPAALRVCNINNIDPMQLVSRHAAGDWGDLGQEDVQANIQAVNHDLRILSVYVVGSERLYCITEADRSSTCLLLTSEY